MLPHRGYRKLIVYQRMMELVKIVYKLTTAFPKSEIYGLTSQMRRASVSIVSNFAEGYLKRSSKEKLLFLERSVTSLHELETQTDISVNIKYLALKNYSTLVDKISEVGYLLDRYRQKIQS